MEEIRHNNNPESSSSFDTSDNKKKPKKKSNLPISGFARVEDSTAEALNPKPKVTALEIALANLAAKKNSEKLDVEKKINRAPSPVAEVWSERPFQNATKTETAALAVEVEQDDEQADEEVYESLPNQEMTAVDLGGGGEFIVHLNGETPITERVIELEDTEVARRNDDARRVREQAENQAEKLSSTDEEDEPNSPHVQPPVTPSGIPINPNLAPTTNTITPNVIPSVTANRFTRPPIPGVNPNTPPSVNPLNANIPPSPNVFYQQYNANATPVQPNIANATVTKEQLDDAVYAAAKAGQSRGVVAGLFAGGLYEHFKHRRREKRAQKKFEQQSKELQEAKNDHNFTLQEHDKRHSQYERRLQMAESQALVVEKQANALPDKQAEKSKRNPEIQQPVQDAEQLIVPEGHRIETSAWHAIEVDNKTGKAVENPTFAYGREYYRERAQENAPVDQRSAAAAGVAIAATTGNIDDSSDHAQSSRSHIPDATTQRPPTNHSGKSSKSSGSQSDDASYTTLWPWAVALAVIVAILVLLLA